MSRPHPVLIRHPSAGWLEAARVAVRLAEADGSGGDLAGRVIAAPLVAGGVALGPLGARIAIDLDEDRALIEVEVRNPTAHPIRVDALVVGLSWRAPATGALRLLRQGFQSWSPIEARELDGAGEPAFPSGPWLRGMFHALGAPPPDRAGWHESDGVIVVGASPSGPTCVAGALERGESFGVVYARRAEPAAGDVQVDLEVELRTEVTLRPGGRLAPEPVRVALGDDVTALLAAHAEEHGRRSRARARAPFQAGWCSWYHFFHGVREADVLRNLEALAASRLELPIDVVQIDDGYQHAIGDWLVPNDKFPRGMAPLAAEIRAAGFVPGLWTAPLLAAPDSHFFALHRRWLLRDGAELFRGLHHAMWTKGGWIHVLDASRDEVLGHLRSTFEELREMGFTYQKLDFLYAGAMQADAHDPAISRARRLRRALEAVRAGCGDDAFLLGCGCPLGAAVGVVDGMRIGPDVAPYWGNQPVVIPGMEKTGPSTRNALRNTLARAWMHRRLWLNDPDCLMARTRDTQLSETEARTFAGAVAATGGMVIFSDDVPLLAADERRLVRDALALAREVDASGGVRAVQGLLEGDVAVGVVAPTRTGEVVLLVNAADDTRECRIDLPGHAPRPVRPAALLGTAETTLSQGTLSAVLPPHGSALVQLGRGPGVAVFCDFDGTFAVQDVGSTLARRYAGARRPALWARYERGELTAWEYNLELLDGIGIPEAALEAFLQTVELDPGARDLLAWCGDHDVPFRVLSDGFDRNLDRLQEIHEVRFDYDANGLRYEEGRWRIRAVWPDPTCACGTGTCKRGRLRAYRDANPTSLLVHIGNGRVSDLCAAEAADLVFAKDTLAAELARCGRPFEPFETLHDVIPVLERVLLERTA
jgi:alpha-galactosidase